jgi:cell division protein FtsW (lipid II flippase)
MVHLDWFHYHFSVYAILIRATIRDILTLLAVIIVHFKSRMSHRNIVLSAILFLNVRVRFVRKLCFQNVFKQHHRDRFNILLGKTVDLKGIGYNTNQSEIAIGSEAGLGKVFLKDPNQRRITRTNTLHLYYCRRRMGICRLFSSNCYLLGYSLG